MKSYLLLWCLKVCLCTAESFGCSYAGKNDSSLTNICCGDLDESNKTIDKGDGINCYSC
jgi:hypothetical protein